MLFSIGLVYSLLANLFYETNLFYNLLNFFLQIGLIFLFKHLIY